MPDIDDPFKPSDATVRRPRPGAGRRPGAAPPAGYPSPQGPGETFTAGPRPAGYAEPFALLSDTPTEYGINLMAVYFIAHHHGGQVRAENSPEGGTLFTITLPLNCNHQPKPEPEESFVQKALLNEKLWERLMAADY